MRLLVSILVSILLGTVGAAPALAAEPCQPLDEQDFRDLLLQLQAGIDRGDLDLSKEVLRAMHARIPCLTFAPEPRRVADLLVGEAILAFAEGSDWEPAMTTALRIYPRVERGVSSRHPLATWEPPAASPPLSVVEVDDRIYVDGLPGQTLPPDDEVHLVQRTDGRYWNSLLTGPDDPLPRDWVDEPVEQPPRVISWGAVGVGLGYGSVSQVYESGSAQYVRAIAPGERTAPAISAHVQGQATFFSAFGVYGRASGWAWGRSPGLDAHVAAIARWRGLSLGPGVGTSSVDLFQGPEDAETVVVLEEEITYTEEHQIFMPRYPLATVHLRGGRTTRWHVGVTGGGHRNAQRGLLEAHLGPGIDTRRRWRFGATLEWTSALVDDPGSNLSVRLSSVRSGLHLSRTLGEY